MLGGPGWVRTGHSTCPLAIVVAITVRIQKARSFIAIVHIGFTSSTTPTRYQQRVDFWHNLGEGNLPLGSKKKGMQAKMLEHVRQKLVLRRWEEAIGAGLNKNRQR